MLNELSIHNYKSIRNVHLTQLPSLCVLVGANAAGKSNFADALDFLSMVFRTSLSSAVRAKGGYENICFRRAKRSRAGLTFGLKTTITRTHQGSRSKKKEITFTFFYNFTFSTPTRKITPEYEVTSENIMVTSRPVGAEKQETLTIERKKSEAIKYHHHDPAKMGEFELTKDFLEYYVKVKNVKMERDELFLTSLTSMFGGFHPFNLLTKVLGSCGVYQISPFVARETGIPERSPELGKHGDNLPAAVNYLQRFEPKAFEELLEHVNHTVPTMEELSTSYVETKQLGLFFREHGVVRRWFSQDVSDGTIQTVAIFLPLVDPRKEMLVIEEPENSLHPWILRHFIDSCKQHSTDTQIFVTTQSPVAVNEVPIESLYIVSRHKGESSIDRCIEKNPELKQVILEQLMGLGEYWDSGAIEGVPKYGEQLRLPEE
jgi:predicted ATPase